MANKEETSKTNPYVCLNGIKCFYCFQVGHKSNEYPIRKQIQLLEGEIDAEASEDPKTVDNDIKELEEDDREALNCILKWILIIPRQLVPSQRNAIFRTLCTINGKVCDLLVDNRSTKILFQIEW